MTITFCPFCGNGEHVQFEEERSAFVEFSDSPEGMEPEEDAIYTFECCGRSVALLAKRD